ncbi:MAG: hypothetical protein V7603_3158 [Micromonosporaceae bacterium]
MNGWAFLVARGRRRGYRSILVPDFLVESNEYGMLTESVRGDVDPAGAPRIQQITARSAGRLALAYRTWRMTGADLDPGGGGEPPTDMHGRPLDLLYGFVSRAAAIREASEADLRSARAEALRAYRRFLADEAAFTVQPSRAFALHSVLDGAVAAAPRPGPPSRGLTSRGVRSGGWKVAAGAVVAAAAVVTGVAVSVWPGVDVPARAACDLDARTRDCVMRVPVRATGLGGLSFAGTGLHPVTGAAAWRVDDADCRSGAGGSACTITVTVTAAAGTVDREFAATLTVRLSRPGRTGTVELTAGS